MLCVLLKWLENVCLMFCFWKKADLIIVFFLCPICLFILPICLKGRSLILFRTKFFDVCDSVVYFCIHTYISGRLILTESGTCVWRVHVFVNNWLHSITISNSVIARLSNFPRACSINRFTGPTGVFMFRGMDFTHRNRTQVNTCRKGNMGLYVHRNHWGLLRTGKLGGREFYI